MVKKRNYITLDVRPSKLPAATKYEYFKKIEIEGKPRVRAYAEAIDNRIYDLSPVGALKKVEYLKQAWPDYNEIRQTVLAERDDNIMRRAAAAQDKAMELLTTLLDKAIEIAKTGDAKEINASIQTLNTIMPALTATNKPAPVTESSGKREKLVSELIHYCLSFDTTVALIVENLCECSCPTAA